MLLYRLSQTICNFHTLITEVSLSEIMGQVDQLVTSHQQVNGEDLLEAISKPSLYELD